jgi:hypothetical protein
MPLEKREGRVMMKLGNDFMQEHGGNQSQHEA